MTIAARDGDLDEARRLLEGGAKVTGAALTAAIAEGHAEVVCLLLRHGADIHHEVKGHPTFLMWAAFEGHADVARLLLELGVDADQETKRWDSGSTALEKALHKGHPDAVRALLEHGAKYDLPQYHLEEAAFKGQIEMVRVLLEYGTKIGYSCLEKPAASGHIDIVRLLLEHGAEIGLFCLGEAASGGHIDIVRLLIEHGADVNQEAGSETALMKAVSGGYIDIVRLLLERGADVNQQDERDNSALSGAALKGKMDVILLLLEHGAQVTERSLVMAGFGGEEVVRLLLGQNTDSREKLADGEALGVAASQGNIEMMRLLLEQGAKPDAANFAEAISSENLEAVRLLIEYGANVNQKDEEGNTALLLITRYDDCQPSYDFQNQILLERHMERYGAHYGDSAYGDDYFPYMKEISQEHVSIVQLLLEYGADVNQQNDNGQTALMAASSYEDKYDVADNSVKMAIRL